MGEVKEGLRVVLEREEERDPVRELWERVD